MNIKINEEDKDFFNESLSKKKIGMNKHTIIFVLMLCVGFYFIANMVFSATYNPLNISYIGDDIDVKVINNENRLISFSRYKIQPKGNLEFTIRDGSVFLYYLDGVRTVINGKEENISGHAGGEYPYSWAKFETQNSLHTNLLEYPIDELSCSYNIIDNIFKPSHDKKFYISFLPKNKNGDGVEFIKNKKTEGWFVYSRMNESQTDIKKEVYYCKSTTLFINKLSSFLSGERLL